jgi:hypothetical protein
MKMMMQMAMIIQLLLMLMVVVVVMLMVVVQLKMVTSCMQLHRWDSVMLRQLHSGSVLLDQTLWSGKTPLTLTLHC